MSRLAVTLAGVPLASPFILASGVMGMSAASLRRAVTAGAAAVTTKSCGLDERSGHPCPVVVPFAHGVLNAVGLANPGIDEMVRELDGFAANCPAPVLASIYGRSPDEFAEAAARMAVARPALLELNLSCPNVGSEFGRPFAADPALIARVTRAVRARLPNVRFSVKLSLQCPSLTEAAQAAEANGASAITAINSVGPGMLIDPETRRPLLANRVGGLSGPAILPLAVRAVHEIARAVTLPVIGTGGVETAADALQMILAGATAVGIGTAVATRGLAVFGQLARELDGWLASHGIATVNSLRGAVDDR